MRRNESQGPMHTDDRGAGAVTWRSSESKSKQ